MKKHILFGCCLFFFFTASPCQTPAEQAETLYREGRFSQALALYEKEAKDYPKNPFLYYNIGNAYFKMGSTGLAVANYYRAYRLLPRDKDIRHNLAYALASGGESLVPAGVPVSVYNAFFYLSFEELKGLTCGLFWVACLAVWIWLLRRKGRTAALVASVLFALCAAWLYARYKIESRTLAVVAVPVAEIRSGPGINFPANASVSQGHLLTVVDKKDHWYEVVVNAQSLKGWVESDTLEKI